MSVEAAVEKLKTNLGKEIGVGEWCQIDQDRINKFAECTGDFQWIHIDEEKAAQGPFGKPIAHGYLTISMIPFLSAGISMDLTGINVMMGVNYGLNKVRLLNPVTVGSKIRLRSVLSDVVDKGGGRILMTNTQTIEIEGQEKPALVAEALSMLFVG
ncbi:MAG: MaoC family dehydratase [Proteobacteria bacterium]|nr:MaoC family dehydratase [Pseudomonadota bacterium]